MEIKMQEYRNAQRGDILRHNGREFVPFPHAELVRSLNEEIQLLKTELEKTKKEHKQQIADILMIVKEMNK
jgi:hypothetical protein